MVTKVNRVDGVECMMGCGLWRCVVVWGRVVNDVLCCMPHGELDHVERVPMEELLVEYEFVCDGLQACLEVGVLAYPMRNAFGKEDTRGCGVTYVCGNSEVVRRFVRVEE